jgi:hypothetical protein
MLVAAREGRSGVLVLRGHPGIGKTALLERAVREAEGFRLLQARGVEPESEIAFAGLQELFAPVADRLDTLPDRQRAVLARALALGPPVPGDPQAVRAATLSMLAATAEDSPMLVLIDDAHWVDPPSAEALTFAARRLDSEGVVALFAIREAEPSAFEPDGLPVLQVRGLADQAAWDLIADHAGPELSPAVYEQLIAIAGGNPLALLELPETLTAGQRDGSEPLIEPLPVGADLERGFVRRLGPLPPDSREALLIAAAAGQDDPGTLAAALRTRGLDESAFDHAEQAGLATIADGSLRFRHPLLRSVVYQAASGDQRRSAHAALAAAADDTADRRAWHLAAAAAGPDERVAIALEDAGGRAAARGGLTTAARTLERAAQLSPDAKARCPRLLAAANLAYASGRPDWAAALIDEGVPLAETATMTGDFKHLAGAVERLRGSMLASRAVLWEAAERVAGEDPARATLMLIDAFLADHLRADLRCATQLPRRSERSSWLNHALQ